MDDPNFTPDGTRKINPADDKTVTSANLRNPAAASIPLQPDFSGTTLGGYQLVRKIAEGGMGVVYEAVQTTLDRRVALKILNDQLASRPEFWRRFEREAKAAAALNHPNIVQVYDFVEVEGRHCLIMEFVDGDDLSMIVDQHGKFSVADSLEIIEQAAHALKFACGKSIIHRDIKPSNLMLTSDGRVKVADLGLAKILTEDSNLTMTNVALGSPHFIAPEQAQDAGSVNHRVDIYALGITLLFLVTGKRPYDGATPFSIVLAHVNKPLPSGKDLGIILPPAVEGLIQRMAAKNPDDRYQDYDSLIADLQRVKTGFAPALKIRKSSSLNKSILIGALSVIIIVPLIVLAIVQNKSRNEKNKISAVSTSPQASPSEQRRFEPRGEPGQRPPFEDPERPPRPGGPEIDRGGGRLPMGPPPPRNFYSIPDGPVETMLAQADQYTAKNKENYIEIITAYEQVLRKAGPAERSIIDRKLSSAIETHQKAMAVVISQYEKKMQEQLRAGKPEEAYNVWRDFPASLRSRESDDQIRKILREALPPDFSPGRPDR